MINSLLLLLQNTLAKRYPGAQVSDLAFLTSGFESDVYTFRLEIPGQPVKPLILRLYPGDGADRKMAREAEGLLHLQEAGYPVPKMLLAEPNAGVIGKPYNVMEKLEGQSLWPVLATASEEQAAGLLERFGALLADLHRLDWRPFTAQANYYAADPSRLILENIRDSWQMLTKFDLVGFLPILDWLENRITSIIVRPAVVHLDFHANNVFLCRDGRMAVIDWTQVSVADYRFDLSWTLLIMGDFGKAEWGRKILQHYKHAAGWSVEDLPYFDVISSIKLLSSTMIYLKTSPEVVGLRPEASQGVSEQIPVFRRLLQRIIQTTGLSIPEIEALVNL